MQHPTLAVAVTFPRDMKVFKAVAIAQRAHHLRDAGAITPVWIDDHDINPEA